MAGQSSSTDDSGRPKYLNTDTCSSGAPCTVKETSCARAASRNPTGSKTRQRRETALVPNQPVNHEVNRKIRSVTSQDLLKGVGGGGGE
jgi:hypothetical protein